MPINVATTILSSRGNRKAKEAQDGEYFEKAASELDTQIVEGLAFDFRFHTDPCKYFCDQWSSFPFCLMPFRQVCAHVCMCSLSLPLSLSHAQTCLTSNRQKRDDDGEEEEEEEKKPGFYRILSFWMCFPMHYLSKYVKQPNSIC